MTAKISRPSLALAVVLLASACSGLSGGGGSKTQSGGAVTGTVLLPKAPTPAIAFYSDRCPMSGTTAALESLSGAVAAGAVALFTTVLPPLIEAGIANVSTWLDERAMAPNTTT